MGLGFMLPSRLRLGFSAHSRYAKGKSNVAWMERSVIRELPRSGHCFTRCHAVHGIPGLRASRSIQATFDFFLYSLSVEESNVSSLYHLSKKFLMTFMQISRIDTVFKIGNGVFGEYRFKSTLI
jgi:hypothetical protein